MGIMSRGGSAGRSPLLSKNTESVLGTEAASKKSMEQNQARWAANSMLQQQNASYVSRLVKQNSAGYGDTDSNFESNWTETDDYQQEDWNTL